MTYKTPYSKGFTLIEIAIVFVIFGFIFTPLVAIIVQQDLQKKSRDNVGGNDRAATAISFYLKQNGRYPCPADPTLAPGDAGFGIEDCTPAAGDPVQLVAGPPGGRVVTSIRPGVDDRNILVGALPTQTLGLPFHAAANEDSWKHIYAVTQTLADPAFTFDGIGGVFIADAPEPSAPDDVPATHVHFAIVNMGKDGKGAYPLSPRPGLTAPDIACGGALDSENCDGDVLFLNLNQTTEADSANDPNYYDDSLAYNHINEKNDFWVLRNSSRDRVEIANRTMGNVGFGVPNPDKKLSISGDDDVLIESNPDLGLGSTGGNVEASADINVRGSVETTNLLVLHGDANFIAGSFCSKGRGYRFGPGTSDYDCCPIASGNNLYFLSTGSATSPFIQVCGGGCPEGQVSDGGACCTVEQHDSADPPSAGVGRC